ncbi:MAG: hypothetical protein JWP30_1842 [Homoserinimonas sp.]|jgi:uncharacterized protein (DUF305 family)|nr:hypothetical protein [Homoserinimonas sp.]
MGETTRVQARERRRQPTFFLKQMSVHHQNAIDMAQTELDDGANGDAMELAQQIIDSQEAEIDEMKTILATL